MKNDIQNRMEKSKKNNERWFIAITIFSGILFLLGLYVAGHFVIKFW